MFESILAVIGILVLIALSLLGLIEFLVWYGDWQDRQEQTRKLKKELIEEQRKELELRNRFDSLRLESIKKYGVDISSDWDRTATSKTAALEQAYLRGRADERKRYEEIMNEDRPACCIDHDVYGATCDTCEYWLDED